MKLATAFGASARSSAMVIVPPDVSIRAVSSAPAATAYIATATNAAAPQKRRMCPHISRPDCHHHHQNTGKRSCPVGRAKKGTMRGWHVDDRCSHIHSRAPRPKPRCVRAECSVEENGG